MTSWNKPRRCWYHTPAITAQVTYRYFPSQPETFNHAGSPPDCNILTFELALDKERVLDIIEAVHVCKSLLKEVKAHCCADAAAYEQEREQHGY